MQTANGSPFFLYWIFQTAFHWFGHRIFQTDHRNVFSPFQWRETGINISQETGYLCLLETEIMLQRMSSIIWTIGQWARRWCFQYLFENAASLSHIWTRTSQETQNKITRCTTKTNWKNKNYRAPPPSPLGEPESKKIGFIK